MRINNHVQDGWYVVRHPSSVSPKFQASEPFGSEEEAREAVEEMKRLGLDASCSIIEASSAEGAILMVESASKEI